LEIDPMYDQLASRLKQHGQQHVLAFWDQLDDAGRQTLANQIEKLDLDLIDRLYRDKSAQENWAELANRAVPPPAIRLNADNEFSADQARERGEQALSAGQFGVLLVAGGQGSRLGFDHPKGMFPIGPVSGAPLFQILIEKIVARGQRHRAAIPLYLMTSPATHEETIEFLEAHGRFGLAAADLHVFCQGTMPAVDAATGQLLLAEKGELFSGPDGHGGMLAALHSSGALADIRRRGIRQLFYCQVDNPLVSMCDPAFVGYHLLARSELTTQVVRKQTPREKVGNVALIDGQLRIIEYSDLNPLPDDVVDRRQADGSPVFWAGSIAVHVFDAAFLERVAGSDAGLPFHFAKKAVPYIAADGNRFEPDAPNAIKFERFIFDLLPFAERGIVVEVDEATAFAPLKNASGEKFDTVETVQARLIELYTGWLRRAGAHVAPGAPVEISPLWAQDAAEVAQMASPGLTVTQPRYFC